MKEQPNFSYIHQLSGGDQNFEIKLLEVVKRELPEDIEIYRRNIQKENYIKASENVHKLKHKISILGLEKSYRLAELYEDELREGRNERQAKFEVILRKMLAFIKS